jgi:excisionase family DNA binding protein
MQASGDKRAYVAPKELAAELRVSVTTVYRGIERGAIPAVRLVEQGALRIRRDALDGLLHGTVVGGGVK